MRSGFPVIALVVLLGGAAATYAQPPISGRPAPQLGFLDDIVLDYMDLHDLPGVVLGISNNGRMVYNRGYGWNDQARTVPMPENAAFRVASVTKTFTAAVIKDLEDKGLLDLDDFAFDLGQSGGGILDLEPFPQLNDLDYRQITVRHLLFHEGGWDRELALDPTGRELRIQQDMGLDHLPTPAETMRWTMSRNLQYAPGDTSVYANIGYLALGLVIEEVAGTDVLSYVRTHLLTEDLYYPADDLIYGRTFAADQDPREPYYTSSLMWTNVYDPSGPLVPAPYGGVSMEMKDSYGRFVATAVPLLHQAHHFYLNRAGRGMPINDVHVSTSHGGALLGSSSLLQQRSDGIDFVVLVNAYDGERHFAQDLGALIDAALNRTIQWPAEALDCRWMDFAHGGQELGSYDLPYGDVGDLGSIPAYSKVKIKPGSSPWTGVITRGHLALMTTAGGSVTIGN